MYGRLIMESPFHTGARRAAFRWVSREWHRFLLFHSVLGPVIKEGGPGRTIVGHWRQEAVEEELRRWRRMKTVNLDRLLVQLVGEGASFRGIQRQAIQAIVQQKSPVVTIIGTGAGKSLLFMLPAACSDGLTIVVVPLISLREDLKRRCSEAGISYVEWDSRKA